MTGKRDHMVFSVPKEDGINNSLLFPWQEEVRKCRKENMCALLVVDAATVDNNMGITLKN